MELPSSQKAWETAAQFLIEGQEEDAAKVLLSCSPRAWESSGIEDLNGEIHYRGVDIELTAPRAAYEILSNPSDPITETIIGAFSAVLPTGFYVRRLTPRIGSVLMDSVEELTATKEKAQKRVPAKIRKRREHVKLLHNAGHSIESIAKSVGWSKRTINRDLAELTRQREID